MDEITERDVRIWEREVEQDFRTLKKDAEAIKEKILWGRTHKAWAKLGFASWTKWLEAFAERMGVSKRRIYQVLEGEKPQNKTRNSCEISSQIADSCPKKGISIPTVHVYFDHEKRQLPENLVAFFEEIDAELRSAEILIRHLEKYFKDRDDPKDPVWRHCRMRKIKEYIYNLKQEIKAFRPWAWCPICGGDGGIDGGCMTCHGTGWVRHIEWSTIPEKDR